MLGLQRVLKSIRLEREIIRRFRESAACSVDLARSPRDIGVENSPVLRKLQRHGIIRSGGYDIYFLDERQYLTVRLNRSKWAMMLLFLLIGVVLILLLRK
jgi:hypothetical protein